MLKNRTGAGRDVHAVFEYGRRLSPEKPCVWTFLASNTFSLMSLFDALDSAIQETEEFKRNKDESFETSRTQTTTEQTKPNSKTTNPAISTNKPMIGPGNELMENRGKNIKNDLADPNAIKIGVSNVFQSSSTSEKLPPLPAKGTDPVVSTAMLKLNSMLAAPDEKVYSPR